MSKKTKAAAKAETKGAVTESAAAKPKDEVVILRAPAEVKYGNELAYLQSADPHKRPFSWSLSPRMVRTFILGSESSDKLDKKIAQKWFGESSIVERAIVTLASDRGLLLIGDPGTGKSWLAELLAAAICGKSVNVLQGTAGTTEDQIKYGWNIAQVIAEGQSKDSLIPSPIMSAMLQGSIGRFEELTRCTSDVQDAMISIMSEKCISIPELESDNVVFARPGFNIIATANSRDRGVNELSSALKRRFNFVHIPIVTVKKTEREIIEFRTQDLMARHGFQIDLPPTLLEILIQTFSDLRKFNSGTGSEEQRLESALSTAEQIGVLEDAILYGRFFSAGVIAPDVLGRSVVSTLVRRLPEDISILSKFWHGVVEAYAEKGSDWKGFAEGGKSALAKGQ